MLLVLEALWGANVAANSAPCRRLLQKVLEQITCCCSFTPPIGQIMKYSMKYAKKK